MSDGLDEIADHYLMGFGEVEPVEKVYLKALLLNAMQDAQMLVRIEQLDSCECSKLSPDWSSVPRWDTPICILCGAAKCADNAIQEFGHTGAMSLKEHQVLQMGHSYDPLTGEDITEKKIAQINVWAKDRNKEIRKIEFFTLQNLPTFLREQLGDLVLTKPLIVVYELMDGSYQFQEIGAKPEDIAQFMQELIKEDGIDIEKAFGGDESE